MSRSQYCSHRIGLTIVAAIGMSSIGSPVRAQLGGMTPGANLKQTVIAPVYQRDVNGKGEVPVGLDETFKNGQLIEASVNGASMVSQGVKLVDGKLVGVPVGGPYTINYRVKSANTIKSGSVGPVFVGDLWVLAGQSNMEGVGDLIDVTPPDPPGDGW
jgi:sialate O-acetylesterase